MSKMRAMQVSRPGGPFEMVERGEDPLNAVVCSRVREPPMPRPPTGDRGWMA